MGQLEHTRIEKFKMAGPDLMSVTEADCPETSPYKCLRYGTCYNSSSYCQSETVHRCFNKTLLDSEARLAKFCQQVYSGEAKMPHSSCNLACYLKLNVSDFIPECMHSDSSFTLDWLHYTLLGIIVMIIAYIIMKRYFTQNSLQKSTETAAAGASDNKPTANDHAGIISIVTERRNRHEQPLNLQMGNVAPAPLPVDRDITTPTEGDPLLGEQVTGGGQEGTESDQGYAPSSSSSGHIDTVSAASSSLSSPDEQQSSTPNEEQAARDRSHQTRLHMSATSGTTEHAPVVTNTTSYRPPGPSNFD